MKKIFESMKSDFHRRREKYAATFLESMFSLIQHVFKVLCIVLVLMLGMFLFGSEEKNEKKTESDSPVKVIEVKQDDSDLIFLQNNLNGTKMEEAIPLILEASKYYRIDTSYYIGIASAESSFNRFSGYNPWGIGANGPVKFNNWEHSINYFSCLIKYQYLDKGLKTPEQMVNRYVGYQNNDWVKNVNFYFNNN